MWKRALEETGVQADRAVHVGNRIDNDIRPAKLVSCAKEACDKW
jgi:FMN phosphatase YigB (HAD superfamily)